MTNPGKTWALSNDARFAAVGNYSHQSDYRVASGHSARSALTPL